MLSWAEHLRQRDRQTSRRHLERAAVIFDALGARPWSQRARAELAAAGVSAPAAPASALGELTSRELQVAVAVSTGMSNREAATALFVSPKTVEFHLGRVFAKLGVTNRTQLAGLVRLTLPVGVD